MTSQKLVVKSHKLQKEKRPHPEEEMINRYQDQIFLVLVNSRTQIRIYLSYSRKVLVQVEVEGVELVEA